MAYNFSFFFRGTHLDPVLLKRSLRGVLSELPHLAGRGRVLGSGSRLVDSVLACNNAGVEVATASARNIRWGRARQGICLVPPGRCSCSQQSTAACPQDTYLTLLCR